jgi:lipopolysaccharide/colanic/teichoic acid biosynthesis glycosyltransferase
MAKRLLDLVIAGSGLVVLSPLLLAIALAVKLDSPGPVFFRQERVGRGGRIFHIHKFRTMVQAAAALGPQLTVAGDTRITTVGRWLRRYKLDELGQLIDVVLGSMSLVGPRPEVPRYVAHYPADLRDLVLSVRPGITDWASIRFRDENAILARATDPHRAYVEEVLPHKLELYAQYVKTQSLAGDLRIILCTLAALVPGAGRQPHPENGALTRK